MSRELGVRCLLCVMVVVCGTAVGANRWTGPDLQRLAQRWLDDVGLPADGEGRPLPEVMGLVLDSQDHPLSGVLVGGSDLTDLNGVYSGNVARSASGWIVLDAFGYATGYATLDASCEGVDLFLAWMTPFQALEKVEPDKPAELTVADDESIALTVLVAAEDLSGTPAYVGLADVNVLDVGPLSAPLQPKEPLCLARAFALEAFDETGQAVPAAEGRTFALGVHGIDATERAKLAWFDPESGQWMVLEGACQVAGDGVITCTLPRPWPLYGLFVPGEPPYRPAVGSSAPSVIQSSARPIQIAGDEPPGGQYKSLYQALRDRLRQLEDDRVAGKPGDPCNDSVLRNILEQMAQIARDEAARQRNETGKMHLLWVAGQAILTCQNELAASLMTLAVEITNEIAARLLNEGDCGRLREMIHALDQLQAFGGDQSLAQQLEEKIKRLLASCDVWSGSIRYVYPISKSLPLTGDEFALHSGGRLWVEMHDVRMSTHAETYILMGEVRTRLSFPSVRYVEREPSPMYKDCPDFHDIRVVQDVPFGKDTSNWFYFDGTYDGYTFQVNQPVPAPDAKPVKIRHEHWSTFVDGDGKCGRYPNIVWIIPDEFYSALIHSFMYLGMSPSITLQEMLETGMHSDVAGYETIRGSEPIANPMPMPNHGLYPFTEGEVIWNLIHVQRLLPFER